MNQVFILSESSVRKICVELQFCPFGVTAMHITSYYRVPQGFSNEWSIGSRITLTEEEYETVFAYNKAIIDSMQTHREDNRQELMDNDTVDKNTIDDESDLDESVLTEEDKEWLFANCHNQLHYRQECASMVKHRCSQLKTPQTALCKTPSTPRKRSREEEATDSFAESTTPVLKKRSIGMTLDFATS